MCGLWWTVQNQNTFLVFPQTTWPGHDFQDKALNSRFPENQPHQHLTKECECKFVQMYGILQNAIKIIRQITHTVPLVNNHIQPN